MKLRLPAEQLAGANHLARFTDKARLHLAGDLPPDYQRSFGNPIGLDGQFMKAFDLSLPDFLAAVEASACDGELSQWFRERTTEDQRAAWNEASSNFGRPGHPGDKILQRVRERLYPTLPADFAGSVFEAIAIDERGMA